MAAEHDVRLPVHIRWLIRRDMAEVRAIEAESFEFPWSEEDFIRCLRQRNCIGMVAERDDRIEGFMIYELHKTRLHVLNFAVAPSSRRKGIGSEMVEKLARKLSGQRRTRLTLEVRETNLAAQLFFRAVGFRCISVLPDFYEDTSDSAYVFEYRYRPPSNEATATADERQSPRCDDAPSDRLKGFVELVEEMRRAQQASEGRRLKAAEHKERRRLESIVDAAIRVRLARPPDELANEQRSAADET